MKFRFGRGLVKKVNWCREYYELNHVVETRKKKAKSEGNRKRDERERGESTWPWIVGGGGAKHRRRRERESGKRGQKFLFCLLLLSVFLQSDPFLLPRQFYRVFSKPGPMRNRSLCRAPRFQATPHRHSGTSFEYYCDILILMKYLTFFKPIS